MSTPYEFKPSPVQPVKLPEPEKAPQASKNVAPSSGSRRDDLGPLLANLRQAAVTATRNEIPVDQSDMRGW